MSEIHYVNRVDQSPFQKLEADKIAESESTQPDPEAKFIVGESAVNVVLDPIIEQAAVDLGSAPHHALEQSNPQTSIRCSGGVDLEKLLEEPDDNIGNVDTDIASTSTPDPTLILLSQLLKENLAEIEFKRQVISAFKHLGLDTRKHFGV
jgi:hypothetical protein